MCDGCFFFDSPRLFIPQQRESRFLFPSGRRNDFNLERASQSVHAVRRRPFEARPSVLSFFFSFFLSFFLPSFLLPLLSFLSVDFTRCINVALARAKLTIVFTWRKRRAREKRGGNNRRKKAVKAAFSFRLTVIRSRCVKSSRLRGERTTSYSRLRFLARKLLTSTRLTSTDKTPTRVREGCT